MSDVPRPREALDNSKDSAPAELRRVTITRREHLWDVVRERAENGETIRGCRSLEEAFDAVRAHEGETMAELREERNRYRSALERMADDHCNDSACVCCGFDQGNARASLSSGGATDSEGKDNG